LVEMTHVLVALAKNIKTAVVKTNNS